MTQISEIVCVCCAHLTHLFPARLRFTGDKAVHDLNSQDKKSGLSAQTRRHDTLSASKQKEEWDGGQPVLDMVPRVSLGYHFMLFIARLFTFLFPLSVLIRGGGVWGANERGGSIGGRLGY